VECHPNQINQVFMNLLVNACQAMDGPGTIRITTRLVDGPGDRAASGGAGPAVEIAIADTGRGIPPDDLPRVFDPGFTTKGVGVGTGLGLSICYQIVEAHGGNIAAASRPGSGTTFTVTLPVGR
jgi:signal transduction histidine kinase